MTKLDWKSEFNNKWGKMCLVDDMGGHYIGSYVIEFIDSLLTQSKEEARKEERERIAKMIKKNYYCSYKKDLDKLSQYGKGSREGINSVVLEICASLTKTEGKE